MLAMVKYEITVYFKSGDATRFHLFALSGHELMANITLMANKYCWVIDSMHISRVDKIGFNEQED